MTLSIWNGTSWVASTGVKVWNGTSWVSASAGKIWNGSTWKDFLFNLTAGGSSIFYPGFKGVESRTDSFYGYTNGSGTGYLSGTFGSFSGQILGSNVSYFEWEGTAYEFSGNVGKWNVRLSGNVTSPVSVVLNGTVVTNSKTGTFDGTNTTWVWNSTSGDTVTYVGINSPFVSGQGYNVTLQ